MTIPFVKLKARLMANPKVKAEYDALAPEFEIAAELLKARLRAGLSQAELAARMGTSQSAIARLESGQKASEHQDAPALRKSNRQQVPGAAFGGLRTNPISAADVRQAPRRVLAILEPCARHARQRARRA